MQERNANKKEKYTRKDIKELKKTKGRNGQGGGRGARMNIQRKKKQKVKT